MTDPVPLTAPTMPRHDHGCRCWPHVSEQDAVDAIAHAATVEYRAGRARSTPSVDGLREWLLEAMSDPLGPDFGCAGTLEYLASFIAEHRALAATPTPAAER